MTVHFWVPEGTLDESFTAWHPDREPERYPSGVGHALLELYKRLEARGRDVSIGPVPPPGVERILLHLESVWSWSSRGPNDERLAQVLKVIRRAGTVTAIRGDIPFEISLDLPHVVEVMPNRASISRINQTWVPLLPQRGLVPRDSSRRGTVRSVGLLAYEINVPAEYRCAEWTAALAACGMELVERVYDAVGPRAPAWHDLSNIDVVLCVRHDALGSGFLRKPATKLINAWAAGAIPIIGAKEPGLVELARPDIDSIAVEEPRDVVGALHRLRDSAFVQALEAGGRERAAAFTVDAVLDQWEALLDRPRSATASLRTTAAWAAPAARAAGRRAKARLSRWRR